MGLFMSIFVVAGFYMIVFYFWSKLQPRNDSDLPLIKSLLAWLAKAVIFPLLVWLSINCGLWPSVPILAPAVAEVRAAGGDWLSPLLDSAGAVLFIISSYWAGLSLLWIILQPESGGQDRKEFQKTLLFWLALAAPVAGVLFWLW